MAGDACGFDGLNNRAPREKPARPSAPGRASEQARMRVNAERDRRRQRCHSAPEKTLNAVAVQLISTISGKLRALIDSP